MRSRLAQSPGRIGKLYYFGSLLKSVLRRKPILVWSLGKVGTTALMSTIEEETNRPVLHCHRVTRESHARTRSYHQPIAGRSLDAWRGEFVRHALRFTPRTYTWNIVCGVRDPVARCVSTVFQDGDRYGWFDPENPETERATLNDRIIELFAEDRAGLDWFETELAEVTGINVYAIPFDRARGFQIYEQGRFRVLVIRFEDLQRSGAAALAEFFELSQSPAVKRSNVATDKPYAARYQQFLERVTIPTRVLDQAYGSSLSTHFYDRQELTAMRDRWI